MRTLIHVFLIIENACIAQVAEARLNKTRLTYIHYIQTTLDSVTSIKRHQLTEEL